MNQIQDLLLAFAGGTHEGLKSCAKLLLRFINEGKYTFTQAEFCDHCGFDSRQAARMMFQLREKGIIVSSGSWEGRYMIYSFCTNPATPHQPEEDVPVHAATSDEEDLLDDFFTIPAQEPETAKKDQDEKKTNPEIPVTNRSEILNRDYRPSRGYLKPRMKKAVTAIYEAFGDKAFTSEMFIATLNYTEAHTYASLHKLALMRIVDQRITKEGTRYCLLVNPEENPECFDAAA